MAREPEARLGLEDGNHIHSVDIRFIFDLFLWCQNTFVAPFGQTGHARLRGLASPGAYESLRYFAREGISDRFENIIQYRNRSAILHADTLPYLSCSLRRLFFPDASRDLINCAFSVTTASFPVIDLDTMCP